MLQRLCGIDNNNVSLLKLRCHAVADHAQGIRFGIGAAADIGPFFLRGLRGNDGNRLTRLGHAILRLDGHPGDKCRDTSRRQRRGFAASRGGGGLRRLARRFAAAGYDTRAFLGAA